MSLLARQSEIAERLRIARGWHPSAVAERRLLEVSHRALDSARELERASAAPGGARATAAVTGALAGTFEALANSVLAIRAAAIAELGPDAQADGAESELDALAQLLFAVDQNLRFAAEATAQGQTRAAAVAQVAGGDDAGPD